MIERNDILRAMEGRISRELSGRGGLLGPAPAGLYAPRLYPGTGQDRDFGGEHRTGPENGGGPDHLLCKAKRLPRQQPGGTEPAPGAHCGSFSACLTVGDRVLTPRAEKGMGDPDSPDVTVTFQWTDVRPGYHDPEDPSDPETAQTPKMEHIEINNQYNKEERT